MYIDCDEFQAVVKFLQLKLPVHAATVQAPDEARLLGIRDHDHAVHSFDPDLNEHFIYLNAPSFGECSHDPNTSVLHELVHAWQAEFHRGGPVGHHREYEILSTLVGYRANPYEVEAEEGGKLLAGLGFKVVRP